MQNICKKSQEKEHSMGRKNRNHQVFRPIKVSLNKSNDQDESIVVKKLKEVLTEKDNEIENLRKEGEKSKRTIGILEEKIKKIDFLNEEEKSIYEGEKKPKALEMPAIIREILKANKKKRVIFCEGKENSIDVKIYTILYEDAIIIPVGSWVDVEINVKKFSRMGDYYCGIMDRDKRGKYKQILLRNNNIFCLQVRAVENLLVTDEIILRIMQSLKIEKPKATLKKIKKEIFEEANQESDAHYLADILLFYEPHDVITKVAKKINISKNQYFEEFFALLNKKGKYGVIGDLKKYAPNL